MLLPLPIILVDVEFDSDVDSVVLSLSKSLSVEVESLPQLMVMYVTYFFSQHIKISFVIDIMVSFIIIVTISSLERSITLGSSAFVMTSGSSQLTRVFANVCAPAPPDIEPRLTILAELR